MLKPNSAMQSHFMTRLRENVGLADRLLPLQQRRLSVTSVAGLCDLNLDDDGCNRRTIGLLPLPQTRHEHEIAETDTLRLKQLLLSIESRRISCCIRVFSNGRKSRSALLVYRGRLIGCVFGRRGLNEQLFGQPAYDQIMEDLLCPGNVIDAYPLSDELVLASASLFHGGLNDAFDGASPVQVYPNCVQMMLRNKRTGCVVVNASDESAICVTYVFEGRIAGVYSFAEGWLTKTQAAALNAFESKAGTVISLSLLPVECDTADQLTVSLTGLDLAIR